VIPLRQFIHGTDPMLLTQKLSHRFPQFAPIRVGGLSVTDKQIVAQHPSGAVRVFEADQITAADKWWEEQDQLRECNGK
jgi:hypothetical protein